MLATKNRASSVSSLLISNSEPGTASFLSLLLIGSITFAEASGEMTITYGSGDGSAGCEDEVVDDDVVVL